LTGADCILRLEDDESREGTPSEPLLECSWIEIYLNIPF
jgi:hypothetical protein